MFSENSRISDRQLARLAVLDWFGKGALLLQEMTRTVSVRQFFLYLLAGFLLVFCLSLPFMRTIRETAQRRRYTKKMGKAGEWFSGGNTFDVQFYESGLYPAVIRRNRKPVCAAGKSLGRC